MTAQFFNKANKFNAVDSVSEDSQIKPGVIALSRTGNYTNHGAYFPAAGRKDNRGLAFGRPGSVDAWLFRNAALI